jgi:hypothetical protein
MDKVRKPSISVLIMFINRRFFPFKQIFIYSKDRKAVENINKTFYVFDNV